MLNSSPRIARLLVLTLVLVFMADSTLAAPRQDDRFNPHPSADDIIVPMPGGLEMALRKVVVPGPGFWGNSERVIRIGDETGGIFEGAQRVIVAGSFTTEDAKEWWIYLGKYEVTKAQFAAVMGNGDLKVGLKRLIELSGDREDAKLASLSSASLDAALAEPVRWIGFSAIQSFITAYNNWLFSQSNWQALIPQFRWRLPGSGGTQEQANDIQTGYGFLRLPTEIEWEYAARGGLPKLQQGTGAFESRLPFGDNEVDAYAWTVRNAQNRVKRIGRKNPTLEIYDLFGNVQEITLDVFHPEVGHGKPGGLVARGGSVNTQPQQLRAAMRSEVPIYSTENPQGTMAEHRSPTTGFRLAIGSPVLPNASYRAVLEEDYKAYQDGFRRNAPVGLTLASPIIQTAATFQDVQKQIENIRKKNPDIQRDLAQLGGSLREIERLLDQESRNTSFEFVRSAVLLGAEYGRNLGRLRDIRERAIPALTGMANTSTRNQAILQDAQQKEQGYQRLVDHLFNRYAEQLEKISEYGRTYVEDGFQRLAAQSITEMERLALPIVRDHVTGRLSGSVSKEKWLADLNRALGDPGLKIR